MSQLVLGLVGAAGGLASICGAIHVGKRFAHHWHNSHSGLFCSLCRLHRLDRNSRRLLKQVVQYYRLTQPARIFTEPHWLDPARLGAPLRARAADIAALRNHLFDLEPAPAD